MPEVTPATPAAPVAPVAPVKGRYEIPVFGEKDAEVVLGATEAPAAPAAPDAPEAPEAVAGQKEGKQDAPADSEAKPEEVTPEQAAKREGRRFERRLDKAYKARAEAQARAEQLEKRLAELEKPKAPEGEPKLEQFDYDPEKYAAAKAEFAKSQAAKEYEAKQREASEKQANERLVSDWEEKAERGADKYPDWHEKVGDLKPDVPLVAAIMEAENGDDIAHYLATNVKEARRIAQLPMRTALREIGKLEAKLQSQPEKPKTPSKAPAPITPLTGTAVVVNPAPSDEDDMATFIRKRNKQLGRVR